jgi:2-dehydropantoate 2-reductase
MRLLVVGAGAAGGWFGAVAARGGADTTFVARRAHGEVMRANGLRVIERAAAREERGPGGRDEVAQGPSDKIEPEGEWTARPRVVTSLAEVAGERFDLVLVTVKAPQLAEVLPAAAPLGGVVMTAQNGVEAEEAAAPFVPEDRLAGAVLVIGASLPEPGVVRVAGFRRLIAGAYRPAAVAATRAAVDALAAAGVPASFTDDLAAARWAKLVWNNAWNALTALTGMDCARAVRDPGVRALGVAMMREVEAVGRALGVKLPPGIVDLCLAQAEAVGPIQTSMLQDVLAGRPLEHDALVGVVVRKGQAAGVPTPVNAVVAPLLAGISARLLN